MTTDSSDKIPNVLNETTTVSTSEDSAEATDTPTLSSLVTESASEDTNDTGKRNYFMIIRDKNLQLDSSKLVYNFPDRI